MTKLQQIVLIGFLLTVGSLVYLEATKKEPINWFPSYYNQDKIPLGTYVLFDLLRNSYDPGIQEMSRPPYEVLIDSSLKGTYLFINDQIPFDKTELEKLLAWTGEGNTVFVSANRHSSVLLDTLNIETSEAILLNRITTEPLLNLVNEKLRADHPFHIKRDLSISYFEKIDTISQIVLGVVQVYNDTLQITQPLANFIKATFGKGTIYLHNQPEIFSNYFLLQNDHVTHTENVLSYINNNDLIYWDKHYKSGKRIQISPLYLLLNNKFLKWAYYFVLIGVFLFVLFEGKRKQRSIPIIQPQVNKTIEYTQIIAGMYLDKNEFHEIAKKQITLFLEYIRTRLRISTENINSKFFKTLAARSGNTFEETQELFVFIDKIQQQEFTKKEELIKLNREITTYKKNIDGKS